MNGDVGRLAEWKFLERQPVLKTLCSPGHCQKILWSNGLKSMILVTLKQVLRLDEHYLGKPLVNEPIGRITDAVISRNGRWLGWSTLSGRIILFDLDHSRARPSLDWAAHDGWLRKMAMNPEGTLLASCGAGNLVQLWDTTTGKRTDHYQAGGQTEGVCFSHDGKSVLFGSAEDFAVHRWVFSQPAEANRACQMNDQVWSAALSPDGHSLLVGLDDNHSDQSIRYINLASGKLDVRKTLSGHHATVTGIVALSVPDRMVTSSIDGELLLWDTRQGQIIRQVRAPNHRGIRTLIATDTGIATAGQDGRIDLWDRELNLYCDSWHAHAGLSVPQIVYDRERNQLLSAGCDGKVCVWDFATHQVIQQFEAVGEARCLALSHDGRTLAYGTKQGILYLADRESGKVHQEIRAHSQSLCCVTFAPDDRSLISADFGGELKSWQVSSGEPLFKLQGHQGRIFSLTWNRDGSKLYSTSYDGRILEHDFSSASKVVSFR